MLGQAIGDLLPSAAGVALSPVPIVAVILMLGTPRARSNGPTFAAGWVVGLVAVSVVVLWLAGGADDAGSGTSTAVDALKLVFGLVLLLVAAKLFMADNNAVIMAVVCVVLAAKIIGSGIAGLTD